MSDIAERVEKMPHRTVYRYIDFMDEQFPFKLEVRDFMNINNIQHAHEHLQICYVSKGMCMHTVNDQQSILVKGDVFSIPPYCEHQLRYLDGKEVTIIQIDFMPFFINENLRDITSMKSFVDFWYIEPFMNPTNKSLPKIKVSATNEKLIEAMVLDMQREYEEKHEGYALALKADLLRLLVTLGREYRRVSSLPQKSVSFHEQRSYFKEILTYIDEHFTQELRLVDIANLANMSPTYFSHIFRLLTGTTLTEYINSIRIQKATELFKTSDMNITEVCYYVGFNNTAHFNKMFKKHTGISPSEYRKSL